MKSQKIDISKLTTANFEEFYKSLDTDFQEALIGFFLDEKENIMKKMLRKKKMNKLYDKQININ